MKDKKHQQCDCQDCRWERYIEQLWDGIVKMEFDYAHRQPEDFETMPDRFIVKSLEHWTVDA